MLPQGENLLLRSSSSSFLAVFVFFMVMILMSFTAESRYLRPSDHGLVHQNNPIMDLKSPEMKSFFAGASTELPEARNSSKQQPWWSNTGAPATFPRKREDRVRKVLLISSLTCGGVGVGLIVAAAFIYFFQRQKRSSPLLQSSSTSSSKQIVVRTVSS